MRQGAVCLQTILANQMSIVKQNWFSKQLLSSFPSSRKAFPIYQDGAHEKHNNGGRWRFLWPRTTSYKAYDATPRVKNAFPRLKEYFFSVEKILLLGWKNTFHRVKVFLQVRRTSYSSAKHTASPRHRRIGLERKRCVLTEDSRGLLRAIKSCSTR